MAQNTPADSFMAQNAPVQNTLLAHKNLLMAQPVATTLAHLKLRSRYLHFIAHSNT